MAVFKMMHPPNVANLVMIFHWKKCKIQFYSLEVQCDHWFGERVAEWLRRLTRKPKVRTAVGSNRVANWPTGRPDSKNLA